MNKNVSESIENRVTPKVIMIMAGGTGGHIMPGLAVAQVLAAQGHRVVWLGGAGDTMEGRLVPQHGVALHTISFGGVRGKGLKTKLLAPIRLTQAIVQARKIVRAVQPDVVLGMGGYITVPGGIAAKWCGVPMVLHEQNSIAGLANKLLARIATRVLTGFPNVFTQGIWVGNPVKPEIAALGVPAQRYAARDASQPLRVAVIGGSLGAQALNERVPAALALMDVAQRPVVVHQSGEKQIDALRGYYQAAGVNAECVAFVKDMAQLYAQSDVVICRAGAMTVAELAAAGVASVLVPFPHAVDDHQTYNAQLLVDAGAGVLLAQQELSAESLAQLLYSMSRKQLSQQATQARTVAKPNATDDVAKLCLDVACTAT